MRPAALGEFGVLFQTAEVPELGPGPRPGVRSVAAVSEALKPFFEQGGFTGQLPNQLRCAALLWHDHHAAAHAIAQEDPSAEGSFLHAILHRREPDYANSNYWFRRTGRHLSFPNIAASVRAYLNKPEDEPLGQKLLPGGQWDPLAFVAACAETARPTNDNARINKLREIQALEFEGLVRYLLDSNRG